MSIRDYQVGIIGILRLGLSGSGLVRVHCTKNIGIVPTNEVPCPHKICKICCTSLHITRSSSNVVSGLVKGPSSIAALPKQNSNTEDLNMPRHGVHTVELLAWGDLIDYLVCNL